MKAIGPMPMDPRIQAVFDALFTFMGDSIPTCTCYVTKATVTTSYGISGTDAEGNSFNYSYVQQNGEPPALISASNTPPAHP